MATDLEFQNFLLLAVVQALVGAISQNVVAVSLSTSLEQSSLDLFVLVSEATEDIIGVLDEVETDLDALLSGAVRIETHLTVGANWTDEEWPGHEARPVFARRL